MLPRTLRPSAKSTKAPCTCGEVTLPKKLLPNPGGGVGPGVRVHSNTDMRDKLNHLYHHLMHSMNYPISYQVTLTHASLFRSAE